MKYELYPPLTLIDSDLFGKESPADDHAPAASMPQASEELNLEMPAFLSELVQRRVASQDAFPPAPPAAGQIRRFACIPEADGPGRALGRSYGVLLHTWVSGHCWSGWIVAQEADYATDRDLLLEQEDGPIAPEAAMIQTWNPVRQQVRGDEVILGRLTPHRLAAVSQLAEGAVGHHTFVAPRPGRIGAWDLDHQTVVVTGTALGDDTDPRHGYQQLYRHLANEISIAAARQTQVQPKVTGQGLFAWLNRTFVRPAWTYGALTVLLSQGIWLLASSGLAPETAGGYRSAGHVQRAGGCEPRVRIMFKPDASYADVAVILRRVGATLADGPSETGEVWITLPTDQSTQEAARMLKVSHLVEAADVIPADKRTCSE